MFATLGTDPSLVRTSEAILPRLMEHLFAHFARVCVWLPSFLIGEEFVFRTFLTTAGVPFFPRFWTDDFLELFFARRTHHSFVLSSLGWFASLSTFLSCLSFPFKRFLSTLGSIPIHLVHIPVLPRMGPIHLHPTQPPTQEQKTVLVRQCIAKIHVDHGVVAMDLHTSTLDAWSIQSTLGDGGSASFHGISTVQVQLLRF